jgi:hypothetical protein
MKIIHNKIFILEDFISPNTASFIVENFSKDLKPTPHTGIYGSISNNDENTHKICGKNKVINYDGTKDVAVDLLMSLFPSIEKTMSEIFKKNIVMKSFFYSHMKSGGKNSLHYDNHEDQYTNDYSGILYLADSYTGGAINFPNQDLKLHPKPGTFICFQGTEDIQHEVQEVIDGDRVNIICFFKEMDIYASI